MRAFKDNTGREWRVQVDIDSAKRVKTLLGVNIVAGDFVEVMRQILEDPILQCDITYLLVKPQADELKITQEDFGRSLFGQPIELAKEVLLAELTDFIPNERDRERAKKGVAAFKVLFEKARDVKDQMLVVEIEKPLPTSGLKSGDSQAA